MKKITFLLFFVYAFTQAQIVNIPDTNFKNRLLQASTEINIARDINGINIVIDTNGDNQIQVSEALTVYRLNVSGSEVPNIFDLTGIEAFTNLTSLICSNHSLTQLNVSNLVNLTSLNCKFNNLNNLNINGLNNLSSLYCEGNNLTSLDLTSLTSLSYLSCNQNNLTSLILTGLTSLTQLFCQQNNLTNLDLTGLTSLTYLDCHGNNLTELYLSGLANLTQLHCNDNNLTTLDFTGLSSLVNLHCNGNYFTEMNLSGLTSLTGLSCHDNNLTNLDLSDLPNLGSLECYNNNLTELDLSNNTNMYYFNIVGNPISYLNIKNGDASVFDMNYTFVSDLPNDLYICANSFDIPNIQPNLNQNGNTDQVVTSYCSFIPGGDYNTITGTLSYDVDNNGDCGNDNYPLSLFKVLINDGSETGVSYTDSSGDYVFYTQDGNFTIMPEVENPAFFQILPVSATVNFPTVNNSVVLEDFCVAPNGTHSDLEISIAPITPARPGFEAVYKIVYKNIGNQIMSQTNGISFLFDDNYMDFVSASETPDSQSVGSLSWDYANLMPFETRSIHITILINPPTHPTFPVNINDVFTFLSEIEPTAGDENPTNNSFELEQIVVGAFDPNDITCLQGDFVDSAHIGEELHYLVRFENEGNFAAENVLVEMNINPDQYQVNSMRILGSSHNLQAQINGNLAEFFFEDIQLPANGQGHVLIALKTNNSLENNDSVLLNADIFFDFNFPITTNDAVTVFGTLGVQDSNKASVALYPNPTTDFVHIKSDVWIESIEWYDLKGRLVASETINNYQSQHDFSQQPAGLYVAKIQTIMGVTVQKVVKR